jgi:hypothetical protein
MSAEVFIYNGNGGAEVPDDVVRIRVDPSVTLIAARAFYERKKLAEVELCEGVVEIGEWSFGRSDHSISITKINIANSLRRICDYAFWCSLRCPIRLHDGIESIGRSAFAFCIFTNFRVPPLITVIPNDLLRGCRSMFSLEIPHNATEIHDYAFCNCYCLRNLAFHPYAVIGNNILGEQSAIQLYDLYQLFGSNASIIWGLQHRFDRLPIHSLVYYQSYNQEVLQNLMDAIKLDSTRNQQDCLGMTPLHILACSSVHDLEVYRVIVDKYPTNLITEDRWGAVPLLYAFWGAAPAEIIQFLLESYTSLYPDHVFNWTMIVKTMGRCDTPKESIENLFCVKQMHYPKQPIDWEYLLGEFAKSSQFSLTGALYQERIRYLVMCGMSMRVEALAFKIWRDHIIDMVHTANFLHNIDNSDILHRIREKLTHFEDELLKLKETTTVLELALWKMRMDDLSPEEATHCQKKIKIDESSIRSECRVTCGADVVIRHILPYLIITVADEETDSYAESDSNASSDDESDEESDSNDSSDDESNDRM